MKKILYPNPTNLITNKQLSNLNEQPIVFFGAGFWFLTIESLLIENNISFVITDNDTEKHGKPLGQSNAVILPPTKISEKYKDSWVCISIHNNHLSCEDVYTQLLDMGFSADKIIDLRELVFCINKVTLNDFDEVNKSLEDIESKIIFATYYIFNHRIRIRMIRDICRNNREQYFDSDIIKLREDEIFFDCGGFVGDTVEAFIKQSNNQFRAIYSFEPLEANYKNYNNDLLNDPRIHLFKFGIGIKKSIESFIDKGSGSMIANDGSIMVHIDTIDDILGGKEATFIKMDIEGSEMDALLGAEQTICKYRPKLAICVYHKVMDVFNILRYLKKCVPSYKFYLRHYSVSELETVLYAVTE